MRRWVTRFWRTLSAGGLILGTVFFAASLTPTLVPRTYLMQGLLSGACFAAGYGVGVAWRWLWTYMELPELRERWLFAFKAGAAALCAIIAVLFLWWTKEWQNSIRRLMELEPVDSAHPLEVCAIAILTFLALIILARLFRIVAGLVASRSGRFVPRRVSKVLGFAAAILLFWTLANGVFFHYTFRALDSSFAHFDALIEPERPQPVEAGRSGSAASLVDWRDLGRAGREFVAGGPTAEDIRRVTRTEAMEPIRVYVGLGAADTAEERARLALEELKRVGAFERSVLVIITPTGTGWVDPAAMDTAEFLHHGDIASVALQYSYLSSPLALLVQPNYGLEAARALFAAVYAHWTALPHDARPRLYLHGLSLGAMHSNARPNSSKSSPTRCRAHCGADRPSPAASGAPSPNIATPTRRPGCRASATARSSASSTRTARACPRTHPGDRCASSTCNTLATPSPSSTIATSIGGPNG